MTSLKNKLEMLAAILENVMKDDEFLSLPSDAQDQMEDTLFSCESELLCLKLKEEGENLKCGGSQPSELEFLED